ncbi:MAG: coniferyl aldehyde dehydrogenase [Hyphomicrobiaceae bacterium]|nr:MAG: coniferyl aldehyde dehydrogenase [Hyphomicrobiaceae bacterium]
MNDIAREIPAEDAFADIEQRFWSMHKASRTQPPPGEAERRQSLRALRRAISATSAEIIDAVSRDYGWRSPAETLMAEIVPSLIIVRDALANLSAWMRPEPRSSGVLFWPARNKIIRQPKGLVLIIAPWNYPVHLVIGPLAAALAAGNRVIVKPSEFTPATSAMLKRCLEGALGANRVTVATGGAEMAQGLCQLPFDHILYTGSTAVGKKVMQAAAANLTPVTLELGGKSPAIVHESFDLPLAALRIMRGKLLNAGQTCIAPDYVLAPRKQIEAFTELARKTAGGLYPRLLDNPDYTAIINQRHYDRLAGLAADARSRGARLIVADPAGELAPGEVGAPAQRKMAPVILSGLSDDMAVMREEIFGPLLPIVPYDSLDEALAYVNARPRPLALYYFDEDRRRISHVLERTVSGGVTVNDTLYHFAQEKLPFGGIGPSGMGAYHGRDGFSTFSHAKATFVQARHTMTSHLAPPYNRLFDWLMRFAVRRNGGRAIRR